MDDGSPDPPDDVLAAVADRLDVRLVRRERSGGPAIARNDGVHQARGRVLAFTDDDCRVDRWWLRALVAAVDSGTGVAAGGTARAGLAGNRWARASEAVEAAVYAHENHDALSARFLTTKNLAVGAAEFAAVGGFDPRFRWSEDRDFCDRWLADGCRMAYVPEAIVYHDRPVGAREFWRQHHDYGRGSHRFHALRRARGAPGLRPDLRFYVRLVARSARSSGSAVQRAQATVLTVAAQLATVAGYLSAVGVAARSSRAISTDGGSAARSPSAESAPRLTATSRSAS